MLKFEYMREYYNSLFKALKNKNIDLFRVYQDKLREDDLNNWDNENDYDMLMIELNDCFESIVIPKFEKFNLTFKPSKLRIGLKCPSKKYECNDILLALHQDGISLYYVEVIE